MRSVRRLQNLAKQISTGSVASVKSDLARWLHSDVEAIGFRCDFKDLRPAPPSVGFEMAVHRLDDSLAKLLFEDDTVEGRDHLYLARRQSMWDRGFEGGYVAVDPEGQPVYLQFFIPPSQRDLVGQYWGPLFPEVGPDTLLVEGAWVPPRFRRRGIMASALHATTMAAKADAPYTIRYSLSFVEAANKGATIGCRDAGFDVVQRRIESWRVGRLSVRFEDAAESDYAHLDWGKATT